MRKCYPIGALLLAAACVTQVAGTILEFPGRADWRGCIHDRLEGLGYRVAAADSSEVEADRGGIRFRATAADTAAPPVVRLELSGPAGRADADSVILACAALPQIGA